MKKKILSIILTAILIISFLPITAMAAVPGDNNDSHNWEATQHVDIMIISCHPDDDQLYLGGIAPIYSQQGKKIVTIFCTPGNSKSTAAKRTQEARNGRWLVGDQLEPEFGPFVDGFPHSDQKAAEMWPEQELLFFLVEMIRKYTPTVIVSQDPNGEYGHRAHKWMVKGILKAFELSGNPYFYMETAETYGTWNPLKLWLHLWPENQIKLDLHQPLPNFNGKTAFQMAKIGFKCHKSQQNGHHHVGEWYPDEFGLAKSLVGYSVETNNLFESITLATLFENNTFNQVQQTQEYKDYLFKKEETKRQRYKNYKPYYYE